MQDTESSQRAFTVAGKEEYLAPYYRALRELPGQLDAVSLLLSDNPTQIGRLKTLRADIDDKLVTVRLRIAQRHQLGATALDPKYLTGVGVQKMEKVRADADMMISEENRLLKDRLHVLDAVRVRSEILQLLGGLTSLVLLTAAFVGLVKQTLRTNRAEQDAQRSNTQLRDANNELRAFSYSVAPRSAHPVAGHQRVCAGDRRGPMRPSWTPRANACSGASPAMPR